MTLGNLLWPKSLLLPIIHASFADEAPPMSVEPTLSEGIFFPADLVSMGRAYDQLCDELGYQQAPFAREAIASYIIALAAEGHRDSDWLRETALTALGARAVRHNDFVMARDAARIGLIGYWEQIADDNRKRNRHGPVLRAVGWTAFTAVAASLWAINLAPFVLTVLN